MKSRIIFGWLFVGLLAVGCGRMSPVTCAPENKPLAESLNEEIKRKDLKGVQSVAAAADKRDASRMPGDEKEAIKWLLATCEKGEWDKAKDYLEKCLASGK